MSARSALALTLAVALLAAATPSPLLATSGNAVQDVYGSSTGQSTGGSAAIAVYDLNGGPGTGGINPTPVTAAIQPTPASETVAPVITNLIPSDGSITGTTVNFSADYSDAEPSSGIKLSTAMLHIDNHHQSAAVPTASGITCVKSGLTGGTHTIEAFVCDNNLNCSKATWHITVDAAAPVISSPQPSGTLNSNAASVSAAFSDGAGAGVDPASAAVTIDGSAVSGCSISASGLSCPVTGLAEGSHAVTVDVSDLVGNHSASSWSFSVDTAAIGVSGQLPAAGSWLTERAPTIGVDFTPAGSGIIDTASIAVLVDGVDVSSDADLSGGGISYVPLGSQLSDGWHDVSVTVNDDAGHSGHSEWSFAVDATPPVIENTLPREAASARPFITASFADSGSGIDPASASFILDGMDQTAAAVISGNSLSYNPGENLAYGSHNVQLSVRDRAGNLQATAWSFSVPQPPAVPAPAARAGTAASNGYWQPSGAFSPGGIGNWTISGFQAFPNSYYLPWYDSSPASGGVKDEILIRNLGAGEAVVTVTVGAAGKWQGKVPEGGAAVCEMPGTTGGPVRIVCPTGQQLEVTGRLTGAGAVSETRAVPEDALESSLLLPWYETQPGGQATSALVIADAGDKDASVDVYVGDPDIPESLKGHFSIAAGAAARTQLPDTAGGPVRIVCNNDQPLVAGLEVSYQGSAAEITASGSSRLSDRYKVVPAAGDGSGKPVLDGRGKTMLFIGNGNGEDRRVEITIAGKRLVDPANNGNDFFIIPAQGAQAIDTGVSSGDAVEVVCSDCNLGEGIAVSGFNLSAGSVSFAAVTVPEAS
ncbi:MAG: hypothetical protein M1455_02645 [Actinobacteria bacterium]|nr:hypothetical protein [Actinomycetota bacterium]